MSEYLHGAYSKIDVQGVKAVAALGEKAMVAVGTAPVQQFDSWTGKVNVPIVVRNMAEARKLLGYSDNWAEYTLCEVMRHFLENKAIGPLVLINVLDPSTHKTGTDTTISKTPSGGKIVIADAEDIIRSTLAVTGKTLDTDYTMAYDVKAKTITLTEKTAGGLGTSALTITYRSIDISAVTAAVVAGTSDGQGTYTGLEALRSVYPLTGLIPSWVQAPGYSSDPTVEAAMYQTSQKIGGHWDAMIFTDIPIASGGNPLTISGAATWKTANGYTHSNEWACYPMVRGIDGKNYHMSVLRAANFMELVKGNDGIPYYSASNTPEPLIQSLYFGVADDPKVYDDLAINEYLVKYGICSAAFVAGHWAMWGAHTADYGPDSATSVNVADTNMAMLYYIGNDFQARRAQDVDRPMTANDLNSIVLEEQELLDALVSIGALTYGKVFVDAETMTGTDVMMGDYQFSFTITTTPLAKSLTAVVMLVDDGYAIYFAGAEE